MKPNGLAVAGFVCGLVGVLVGLIPLFFFLAWILGVLGVVFGFIGRAKALRGADNKGLATAAWILGFLSIFLGLLGATILSNAFNDLG